MFSLFPFSKILIVNFELKNLEQKKIAAGPEPKITISLFIVINY